MADSGTVELFVRLAGTVSPAALGPPFYKGIMRYLPVPGSHITIDEAQVVGDAIIRAREKFGEAFTVAQFESICKRKRDPIHPIWCKKRDALISAAGRTAAAYLMRSVAIQRLPGANELPKALTIIIGDDRTGRAYSPEYIANSPDLLDDYEDQYIRQLRGISRNFSDVVGIPRMIAACERTIGEFAVRVPRTRRRRAG